MTVRIYVEGKTELQCLKDFLRRGIALFQPKLKHSIQILSAGGSGFFQKKYIRSINTAFSDPKCNIQVIYGLADFYQFPLLEKCPRDCKDTKQKVAWLTNQVESKIDDSRFKMFFAVHEFEAWLLSDPSIFPKGMQDKIAPLCNSPEHVNLQNPPSKCIIEAYRSATGREYNKVLNGSRLLQQLAPSTVLDKCPHFKVFLSAISQAASS